MKEKSKRGRPAGTFEKREYYKKYKANLHTVLEEPGMLYKLDRVLKTKGPYTAAVNSLEVGSLPNKRNMKEISKALFYINITAKKRDDMNLKEYELYLYDPAR